MEAMLGAGSLIPMTVTRLTIGRPRAGPGAYPVAPVRTWQFHAASVGVNPLQTTWFERGAVSGRVALLPRSREA